MAITTSDDTVVQIRPLTGVLGAEISGLDFATLDDAGFEILHAALLDHQVLVVRNQIMNHDQHLALGARFGPLHIHPAHPPGAEGYPELMAVHADSDSTYINGSGWHSDVSCDAEPPSVSILHINTVPPVGGDTLFADMCAAYDALSAPIREMLCGLEAEHTSEQVYRGAYGYSGSARGEDSFPVATHPVVRTHPETSRRALYVNPAFTRRIKGLRAHESRALLDLLFAHAVGPQFQCRVAWEPDTVTLWDNRSVQHHAVWDYYPNVRSGFRVTVRGDAPYFEAEDDQAVGIT